MPHLKLGRTVTTSGIANAMKENSDFEVFVMDCMNRYTNHDWGELSDSDREANDEALSTGGDRIFAAYDMNKDYNVKNSYDMSEKSIWIITEWDRSVTTVLFPGEY